MEKYRDSPISQERLYISFLKFFYFQYPTKKSFFKNLPVFKFLCQDNPDPILSFLRSLSQKIAKIAKWLIFGENNVQSTRLST